MLLFNNIIQQLDLEEIPIKGRAFTWSNMQDSPLLENLDWIFTSTDWTTQYPNTFAVPLAKLTLDHIPIQIQTGTSIPKANISIFEEWLLKFDGFTEVVQTHWQMPAIKSNLAKEITARFQALNWDLKNGAKTCRN